MERETGIEPATFSLGNPVSIENKEHRAQRSPSWFFNFPTISAQPRFAILIGPQTDYGASQVMGSLSRSLGPPARPR
jgi:hypothetical protein